MTIPECRRTGESAWFAALVPVGHTDRSSNANGVKFTCEAIGFVSLAWARLAATRHQVES